MGGETGHSARSAGYPTMGEMTANSSESPATIACHRCGLIHPGGAKTCDCGWPLHTISEPVSGGGGVFVFFVILDLTLLSLAALLAWPLLPMGGIILLSIWPLWYVVLVIGLFLLLRKVTLLALGAYRFGYPGRPRWSFSRRARR